MRIEISLNSLILMLAETRFSLKKIKKSKIIFFFKKKADGLEIYTIPHLSIYMKGEKKKPKNYVDEIDLVKMWRFVWAYFESKIQLPAFTQEEVEEAHVELMNDEDRIVNFKKLKKKFNFFF